MLKIINTKNKNTKQVVSNKIKVVRTCKSLLIALFIALIIRSFFIQAFYIPSGSMKPNLLIGDYLFVSKMSYGYSKYSLPFNIPLLPSHSRIFAGVPERGEIIVFKYPSDTSMDFVKRVIGMPGDKIQVINSVVYVNNKPILRKYVGTQKDDSMEMDVYAETYNGKTYNTYQLKSSNNLYLPSRYYGPVVVPKGHYFMMGDNRDLSKDSRFEEVGFIDNSLLVGKPMFIFFSIDGSFLEIWKWFTGDIRWSRIFSSIQAK